MGLPHVLNVLITGGTGTLGRALARELIGMPSVRRVAIYSRGEHAQADMSQTVDDPKIRYLIGDVRDRWRLQEACEGVDTLIHAAALKRIEVGHYNPEEMFATNIDGARNVIRAARGAGVSRVVGISTDKAYQPISAYGISKAAAECALLAANNTRGDHGPIFSAVRYGNVWGSTGSIVPKWRALVAGGATVLPVTDPACTRFFMRISEAVKLVLDTARHMVGGELAIPTLPAYSIGDLAAAFGLPMRIVGLPAHEKLHESMGPGDSSDTARRMSVDELRAILAE